MFTGSPRPWQVSWVVRRRAGSRKNMGRSGRFWLLTAPVLLCLLDNALTLCGQPAAYWAGDYIKADEGNPIALWCLKQHPAAFAAESLLWIALFGSLVVVLPWQLAKTVSLGVALGHIVGSAMWIGWRFEQYWLFPVLLLSSAGLIVWTWEQAGRVRGGRRAAEPLNGLGTQ